MAISEVAEGGMSNKLRQRVQQQDRTHPHLINIKDARLVPNVALLRKNPDYRVFVGDPKATEQEKRRILDTQGHAERMPVTVRDTTLPKAGIEALSLKVPLAGGEEFDLATCTKEDLVAFTLTYYGVDLDPKTHISTLKSQVRQIARERGEFKSESASENLAGKINVGAAPGGDLG